MSIQKPTQKPVSPNFSCGPCTKIPGWNADFLEKSNLLGRSHRSKEALKLINDVTDQSAKLLNLPKDYKIAIISASDTGAFECAMWNMLGERGVDVIFFEAFGKGWYTDIKTELRLEDVRKFDAPFGILPDISEVDFDRDVVFTLNGTTSGVCFNDTDFIPDNRKGLTFCDATSAVFSLEMDFSKFDVTTYSWQKSLGSEAQHGMLILSPRAVERLNNYQTSWPIPKIFRIKKDGKLMDEVFEGKVLNTPSVMCLLDVQNTMNWIENNGGVAVMQQRVNKNYAVISSFIENSPNFENLCDVEANRSKTSVCFTITHSWFKELDENGKKSFVKRIVDILGEEKVGFDVNGYNTAPPSFRVWCGLTVEAKDIEILCSWFEYAYAVALSER